MKKKLFNRNSKCVKLILGIKINIFIKKDC